MRIRTIRDIHQFVALISSLLHTATPTNTLSPFLTSIFLAPRAGLFLPVLKGGFLSAPGGNLLVRPGGHFIVRSRGDYPVRSGDNFLAIAMVLNRLGHGCDAPRLE